MRQKKKIIWYFLRVVSCYGKKMKERKMFGRTQTNMPKGVCWLHAPSSLITGFGPYDRLGMAGAILEDTLQLGHR